MVSGRQKSASMRKISKKTPGGRVVIHYTKKKPSKAKCSQCGAELKGVPRLRPYKMENTPKTKKRPQRPFGGVLCSKCTTKKIIAKTRAR